MKALKLIAVTLVLGAAGYGGSILWRSGPLQLETVEVVGNEKVAAPNIVAASGLVRGSHLMEMSTRRVERRLETIPRLKRARVERILPSKVRITVQERDPALQILLGSRSFLADSEGVVLDETQHDDPTESRLMVVSGLPLESTEPGDRIDLPQFDDVLTISRELPISLRSRISEVRAASIDRIAFVMNDGVLLLYGAAEDIEKKNHAIVAILDKSSAEGRKVTSIDVRVPSRPAVRAV